MIGELRIAGAHIARTTYGTSGFHLGSVWVKRLSATDDNDARSITASSAGARGAQALVHGILPLDKLAVLEPTRLHLRTREVFALALAGADYRAESLNTTLQNPADRFVHRGLGQKLVANPRAEERCKSRGPGLRARYR